MTREELLTKYEKGERDFREANLADASLYRANLVDANLVDANLYRANLVGANLYRANLDGAYLARANLAGAYLAEAYLAGAYLAEAYLARANLVDANLAEATYGDAELTPEILAWLVLGACTAGVMRFIRGETTQEDVAWCQGELDTDETDVAKLTELAKEKTRQFTEGVKYDS